RPWRCAIARFPAPLAGYAAYVTDLSTGNIALLGAYTAHIAPRVKGLGLSAEGCTLYVTDVADNRLDGFAPGTGGLGTPHTTPVGDQPVHVVNSRDGRTLFVTNFAGANISVIDAATWRHMKDISVPARPHSLVLAPEGRLACVSCCSGAAVAVLDTANATLAATIPVPSPAQPYGLALSVDGRYLYASDNFSGRLIVLDTHARSVASSVNVGLRPALIARSPDGGTLYVANGQSHSVSVLDLTRDPAHPTIHTTVAVDGYPHGLAVTPDGRYIVVANTISKNLSVIDAATDRVVATIAGPGLEYPNDVLITTNA